MMEAGTVFTTVSLMMLANGLGLAGGFPGPPAPPRPAPDWGAGGGALIAAGCAVFAFGAPLPRAAMLLGANASMSFGLTAYHGAIQRFVGAPPSRWLFAPAGVATAGVAWFSIVDPSFQARLVIVSAAWIWLMLATIWALRGAAPQDASLSRRILTGIFWLVLVYTLLRAAAYPIMNPGRDFAVESSANWLNLMSPIFMTLLPVVGTTGFLLMCSDKLRRQLETAAATDYLTGLPNRRTLARNGRDRFRRAEDQGTGFAVAILDIDNFKAINDTYGHEVGDRVLVHIAECLKAETHGADMVARTGGEEFAVLLAKPGHEAVAVVERMRLAVQQAHFSTGSATVAVTLSAGGPPRRPGDGTFEDLLRRADQALYAAKAGGRNRVEIARLALVAAPGVQGPDTAEDDKAPHLRSRMPTGLAN